MKFTTLVTGLALRTCALNDIEWSKISVTHEYAPTSLRKMSGTSSTMPHEIHNAQNLLGLCRQIRRWLPWTETKWFPRTPSLDACQLQCGASSMGVGRIFPGGGATGFFQSFSRGPKVVKFVFSHLKLRKQPFLLKFSKSRGERAPLPPPFRRPWFPVRL